MPPPRCLLLALSLSLPLAGQAPLARLGPPLPIEVTSFGAAETGGWIYVFGGARGRPHHYDRDSQSPHFLRFDPVSGRVEHLPEGPALQGTALVAHRGTLIRVGGLRTPNAPGTPAVHHSVAACARFDPSTRCWTSLPDLPQGRSSHDAWVAGDQLYVAGGWALDGTTDAARWAKEVVALDLNAPEAGWRTVAEQPFTRRALAIAVIDHTLHVLGGLDEEGQPSHRHDCLDLETGAWRAGSKVPGYPFGLAATVHEGRLYHSGRDGSLQVLRADGAGFEEVARLRFPRFFHRLVSYGDTVQVVGGSGPRGRVVWTESHGGEAHGPEMVRTTLPFPQGPKSRYALVPHPRGLRLIGGNRTLEQHGFAEEAFSDEVHLLDLGSLRLEREGTVPAGQQSAMTASLGFGASTRQVVAGGFGHREGRARALDTVLVSADAGGTFAPVAQRLRRPRTQAALLRHGGRLHLFGGLDYDAARPRAEAFQFVGEVTRLTLDGDALREEVIATLPAPRRAFAAAVLGDRAYLVGGMKEGFELLDSIAVFDFRDGSWSELPAPAARVGGDLVALGGRLYLAGGRVRGASGDLEASTSIEVLDPATQRWTTLLPDHGLPPRHLRMVRHGAQLLLLNANVPTGRLHLGLLDPTAPAAN